jgi:energy-coupling factor transporter ATP-binding protein EcfA2
MDRGERGATLRLRQLSLQNVRCFSSLSLDLTYLDGSPLDQVVVYGDTGSGKSAVLSAVAQICELTDDKALSEAYGPRLIRSGHKEATIHLEFQLGAATLGAKLDLSSGDSPWLRPVTHVVQSPATARLAWPPRGRIAYVAPHANPDRRQKLQQLLWRSQRLGRDEEGRVLLHPALQRLSELFHRLDPHRRSLLFLRDSDELWLLAGEVAPRLWDLESLCELAERHQATPLCATWLSDGERAIIDLAAQLVLREVVPEIALLDEPALALAEEHRARLIAALRQSLPTTQLVVATSSRAILRSVHDYERLTIKQ